MKFEVKEIFDQGKYVQEYTKENIKQIKFVLNKKTENELIEWIDKQQNKQGYIKGLIRKDMEEKARMGKSSDGIKRSL